MKGMARWVGVLLLALLAAAPAVVEARDSAANGADIMAAVFHRLGGNTTTRSRMDLVIQEAGEERRFTAEVWSLPDGVYRVELFEPESVTGTVGVAREGKARLLSENPRGRREYNLETIVVLFTLAEDVISARSFLEPIWDGARVTDDVYAGRSVIRVEDEDEDGTLVGVMIDEQSLVPLAVYVDVGQGRETVYSSRDIAVSDTGDIVSYVFGLWAEGMTLELHFRPLDGIFAPTAVRSVIPGLQMDLYIRDTEIAELPESLAVTPEMVPREDERFLQSLELTLAGEYKDAVRLLEALTRDDPYHVAAHVQLGYLYLELGDWIGARASFEQAVVLDPSNLPAYNNLAYVYIDSGIDIESGIAMAEQVVALRPTHAAYLDTLGWGLYKAGRYDNALAVLREAVEHGRAQLFPKALADVLYHYALALQAAGDFPGALDIVREGLVVQPDSPSLLQLLAELESKQDG